jgi:hypothetical protein
MRADAKSLLVSPMLADYPEHVPGGWTLFFEGHYFAIHEMYGQLEVGVVPLQHRDQWVFRENNGGPTLMVGYTRKRNVFAKLFRRPGKIDKVMMLQKDRFNLNGDGLNYEVPEAFIDSANATKWDDSIYKALGGTDCQPEPDAEPISGRGFAGHRQYFVLNSEHEGTSAVAVQLTEQEIAKIADVDWLVLMTWQDAVRNTRDASSGMALARFVADFVG